MTGWRLWAKAVRPYAYSASVVPVAIGGLYAKLDGTHFAGLRFWAALAAGVLMHTAANLWNDYYDYRHGVDRPGGGEGSGVLVRGEMAPARCFRGASLCAMLALATGLWLAWETPGWTLEGLMALGLVGAALYSAGPASPKHRALGEVWVFLFMGVGMTLGGYVVQAGSVSFGVVAAGLPAALLMTLLLFANNLRDVRSDRAAGIKTLPMVLSPKVARAVLDGLLWGPYALTFLLVASSRLPSTTLVVLLTLPMAAAWRREARKEMVGDALVVGMARLHLVFGFAFAAGLWAAGFFAERNAP